MRRRTTTFAVAVVLAGCRGEPGPEPTGPIALDLAVGTAALLTGGGQLVHPTFGPFNFAFTARRDADGTVGGRFEYHYFPFGTGTGGSMIQYKGEVTCFAVDPINHRAWIGGVLTFSNDPSPNPIVQVGHDAWFRFLDNGPATDPANPDRITLVGFEGGAGIPTSEEYCARRIWPGPDDVPPQPVNARTWPVVSGNLTIH